MVFDGDRRLLREETYVPPDLSGEAARGSSQPPQIWTMSRRESRSPSIQCSALPDGAVGVNNELSAGSAASQARQYDPRRLLAANALFPDRFSWRSATLDRRPAHHGDHADYSDKETAEVWVFIADFRAGAARCTRPGSKVSGASPPPCRVEKRCSSAFPIKAARRLPHYQRPRAPIIAYPPDLPPDLPVLSPGKDVPDRPPPVGGAVDGPRLRCERSGAGGDGWPGCGALAPPSAETGRAPSAFGDRLDLD